MESDDEGITFPELSASSSKSSPLGKAVSPGTKDARSMAKSKGGLSTPELAGGLSSLSQHSHGPHSLTKKSITHKRELIAAARRVNPSMTSSAPAIFWNTEGSLKNVLLTPATSSSHLLF